VRGSTPTPGADFIRYGGHTSCVAVIPDGEEQPTLLLDAGTGIRRAPELLSGRAFQGAILLSHLHWDHVLGLPFCTATDRPDAAVEVYLPAQDALTGRDLLARIMSPPAFPITPEGLQGRWRFHAIEPGEFRVPGFGVRCAELAHKGGRTYGYRVTDGISSLAYLPDHSPVQGCSDDVLDLIDGVDVLLHDAQFLQAERQIADAYGHATVDDAIDLAVRAGAKTLVLFHHSPTRTDDELDLIASTVTAPLPVIVARQGYEIAMPQPGPDPVTVPGPDR
jgi:phosphoribosyl 1,2-cyclic phosphodiesterase